MKHKKKLKKLGFKKKWLEDKSGYWFEKKLPHPYFKKLTLNVDLDCGFGITIDVEDINGYMVDIFQSEITMGKVLTILSCFGGWYESNFKI